jgi:2-polyprenyl-6-methoxyphenol hydroxylase-like FAD-dependent oxidoreductase
LVIGADGTGSALRDAMSEASQKVRAAVSELVRVRRYKDTNVLVYRTIPLFWPEDLKAVRPKDLNYSARYRWF